MASRLRCFPLTVVTAVALASLGRLAIADEPLMMPESRGAISGFPDWVTSLAFSPDGSRLACGTYDEVRLVDPQTQQAEKIFKTRNGYVRDLAFSPDGAELIVGDYQTASLWSIGDARRTKKFSGHKAYVTAVAFAGDEIVSGSEDGTVRFWDRDSGELLRMIEVGVPVNAVALSPDRRLIATAGGDVTRPTRPGPVALWNVQSGEKVADLIGHERSALAVAFSPDGTILASAGEDEKVNLYDVAQRKAIGFYAGHSRSVNDMSFLANGAVLASVSGGNAVGKCELHLWKADGTELALVEPHKQRLTAIAISPDEQLVAVASQDKTVSLWNPQPVLKTLVQDATEMSR